jgi:5-methylcytosine-specific restriction endonuclease McrA
MERLTQNHVIAQNNGGQDIAENLITSCGSCNSAKNDNAKGVF